MKKWNTPEVAELNVAETANGIWPADIETIVLFDKKCDKPDTKPGCGNGNEEDEEIVGGLS